MMLILKIFRIVAAAAIILSAFGAMALASASLTPLFSNNIFQNTVIISILLLPIIQVSLFFVGIKYEAKSITISLIFYTVIILTLPFLLVIAELR